MKDSQVFFLAPIFSGLAVVWLLWVQTSMGFLAAAVVAILVGLAALAARPLCGNVRNRWSNVYGLRSSSRRVSVRSVAGMGILYLAFAAVLLLALATTVGIVADNHQTVSSSVLKKGTQERNGYAVTVKCPQCIEGDLTARVDRPTYDSLIVGQPVEVSYHRESILGRYEVATAMDAINSQGVLWGGGRGFREGIVAIELSYLSLLLGVVPLAYTLYKHRIQQ